MMKKIISVVLVVCMMCTLIACVPVKNMKIKNLLSAFQYTCNLNDVETDLGCIAPSVADNIRLATGISGMFTQKTEEELFLELAKWLSGEELRDVNFFITLEIEIRSVVISEDDESAVDEAVVSYELPGKHYIKGDLFDCIYLYYTEQWYISDFSFI